MNVRTVRLGDVATYVNGYAFKPEDWSEKGLQIIRIQDLTGNDYQTNHYDGEYNPKYEVVDGDILISWSASLGVYEWNKGKALLNQHIFKVVFDKLEVDKRYFVYAVRYLLGKMISDIHGSTMKHITKPRFDATEFPYPAIPRQAEIGNNLSLLDELIAIENAKIQKLDDLVKSRFVEMFGDPIENPRGWPYETMKSICTKITDGEHGSVARSEEGHPFLNAKHIKTSGDIEWDSVTFTSDEVHERIYKRCNPEADDIIMTTTGTIGNVAVVPKDREPFTMDRGITLLKLDRNRVKALYIAWLLRQDAIQSIMNANVHASAIGHLFLNKVEQIPVMMPDMWLQDEFSSFVAQTDKSKHCVKNDLLRCLQKQVLSKSYRR